MYLAIYDFVAVVVAVPLQDLVKYKGVYTIVFEVG